MRVFLLHGAFGSPEDNWFPWLKRELESQGHEVVVPAFPTPEGQSLEAWLEAFKQYEHLVDEDSVFVGHSLGAAFALRLLERFKAKKCVLVAGFVGAIGNARFDAINASFMKAFDWEKIKKNCDEFVLINSCDDPYVRFEKGMEIAEKLGTYVMLFPNAGHFNAKEFCFLLRESSRRTS